MKRYIYILLLMALAFQPAFSQNYVLTSVAKTGASSLKIQDNEVVFGTTAASKTITVTTNLEINPVSNADWCTVTANGNQITISVTANPEQAERTAIISLNAKDGQTKTIQVRQFGKDPAVYATPRTIRVTDASQFTFEVASSVAPTFQCPSWITLESPSPAIGTNIYTFNISALSDATLRTDSIIVSGPGANSVTVKVTQTTEQYPSFAVISDVHFGNNTGEGPMVKVPRALKNLSSYKKLDAIFVVGDLANSGAADEYQQLVSVFGDSTNYIYPIDRKVFMLGNHDNFSDIYNYANGLRPFNNGNLYPYDQYMVIKGYPFITISPRSGNAEDDTKASYGVDSYPKAVQDTLSKWLERAATQCPGKPIFVFTHIPPKYTCYCSWPGEGAGTATPTWSMEVLNPILNKYPQAVVFAGHGHYPLGDPRSIHQGVNPNSTRQNYYTVVNTGSTTYCEIEEPALDEGGYPDGYDNVTEGLIASVEPAGNVEIQRYDTRRNEEIQPKAPWLIKAPFDGSQFQYGDMRDADDNVNGKTIRTGLPAPVFASDAKPVIKTTGTGVVVKFPQAKGNDDNIVFRYLVRINSNKGYAIRNSWVFSGYYKNSDMPDSLTTSFSGLQTSTTYTATVTAYDPYNNASTAISSESFTFSGSTDPADVPPTSIGDWTFDDTNNPLANSQGTTQLIAGNVTTSGAITMQSDLASAGINYITGPTDNNKAISVPALSIFRIANTASALSTYTLMYDIRVASVAGFHCLLQTNLNNDDDADFCINRSGALGLNVDGWGYGGNVSLNDWHRVVLSVKDGIPCAYLDGVKVNEGTGTDNGNWLLAEGGTFLFCDNDGEDNDIDVAEISLWDQALNDAQVLNLGTISSGESLSVGTTSINLLDEKEFDLDVSSSLEPSFTCSDWIHLKRPVPSIGKYTYVFSADALTQAGTRTGQIVISGPQGSSVAPVTVTVTQTNNGGQVPDADGVWTFDDNSDLLLNSIDDNVAMEAGTIASDGTVTIAGSASGANIQQIAGPTDDNKAITCPAASMLNVLYDPEGDNDITNYTIMYDVRSNALGSYSALLQTSMTNSNDADFCINPSNKIGLNTGWTYGGEIYPNFWHRIVLTVKDNVPNAYLDGVLVCPGTDPDSRWGISNKGFYLFCDDDGECTDLDVAEVRYWKQTLTADQIQKLGSVDYKYILLYQNSVSLADNNNTFSVGLRSSVVPTVTAPDWIKSVSVNPTTGEQTYTFKADDMTEAGSRQGTITISAPEGSGIADAVITVKQTYDGGQIPVCAGKWTFDNQNDLFTSAEGTATLVPYTLGLDGTLTEVEPANADVIFITGPSDTNGAITVNKGTAFKLGLSEESPLTTYSIQYDLRSSSFSSWRGLIQTTLANDDDADLFFNTNGQIGLGGNVDLGYNGQFDTDTWYRVTFVVKDGYGSIYVNGELLKSTTAAYTNRWTMDKTGCFLFCDNDGETDALDIAELDFWDFALTAAQVTRIGKIK